MRTADATGARGIILIGDCTDPYSVEAVRASMGAVFTELAQMPEDDFLDRLPAGRGRLSAPRCRQAATIAMWIMPGR